MGPIRYRNFSVNKLSNWYTISNIQLGCLKTSVAYILAKNPLLVELDPGWILASVFTNHTNQAFEKINAEQIAEQ